jgi:hypothetical protein
MPPTPPYSFGTHGQRTYLRNDEVFLDVDEVLRTHATQLSKLSHQLLSYNLEELSDGRLLWDLRNSHSSHPLSPLSIIVISRTVISRR